MKDGETGKGTKPIEVLLGTVATMVMGQAPAGKDCNKDGRGTPFVKAGEFGSSRPIIREWTTDPKKFAKTTDVLVCVVGATCGKINLGADCAIGRSAAAVRPDPIKLDQFYLHYYLEGTVEQLRGGSVGAAQTVISRKMLSDLPIPLPPLEEQKRIVAVLDQAFATLNRARAHAEANLADAGELFDNSLLALFEALLPTSQMMTLSEAATDFSRGKSRHRPRNDPKLYGGEYPFIQTGDIRRSAGSIREYTQTYNDAGLAQSKLWPAGTVCITIAANIAETGVLEFEGCFPDSVIGMVPDAKISNAYYVEYMLRFFAKELKLQGKGSAQDNINLTTFENARFPVPGLKEQTAVVEKLDSLAAEVAVLKTSYQKLIADIADLRQSLLQKAFSGQLA